MRASSEGKKRLTDVPVTRKMKVVERRIEPRSKDE
jgi:hypothetical protein